MAEAVSDVPERSVLGPILFAVYVNGLAGNLAIDHLLYGNDAKVITLENIRLPSKAPWLLVHSSRRTRNLFSTVSKANATVLEVPLNL